MAEVEIGLGKSGRAAYGLDDIAIIPSRRTRDPEDVDLSWEIDAFRFELPVMASAMDAVTSPGTAIALGRLGGVGVLNLEGIWTRYDDPEPLLDEIGEISDDAVALRRIHEIYARPVDPDLIGVRVREMRDAGVVSCGAVTPHRVEELTEVIVKAELDLLVIHGTVVSAEHVTRGSGAGDGDEPLNLKTFVRRLDLPVIVGGCSSYQAALHLMRTGAAGVLVGVGAGRTSSTRRVLGTGVAQATAIADARAARMRHLDETGVYIHIIADGGMATGGDIAKAVVCGADAVMLGAPLAAATEAPGRGYHWGPAAVHPTLPRGSRVQVGTRGSLAEILAGPAPDDDGDLNLMGALRRAMALCGHATLKELQKAELVVMT
ncbi:MAG: GuaB3 family IMP dehydrogenase-related protein [Acidimicrobiales bacterium]